MQKTLLVLLMFLATTVFAQDAGRTGYSFADAGLSFGPIPAQTSLRITPLTGDGFFNCPLCAVNFPVWDIIVRTPDGTVVLTTTANIDNPIINLSRLDPGSYIISIHYGDQIYTDRLYISAP